MRIRRSAVVPVGEEQSFRADDSLHLSPADRRTDCLRLPGVWDNGHRAARVVQHLAADRAEQQPPEPTSVGDSGQVDETVMPSLGKLTQERVG